MIITFAHYKGGTGKTTSCLSVAGGVAVMFAKKAIKGKTAGVDLPDELK